MKHHQPSRGLLAGGITAFAVIGLVLFSILDTGNGQRTTTGQSARASSASTEKAGNDNDKAPQKDKKTPSLPLAHTTEDIEIDGAIHVDANGNLVYNEELRRFLDFFIGMTKSPDHEPAMRARMETAMRDKGVPKDIRRDVLSALDAYLSYRSAVEALGELPESADPNALKTFRKLKNLRRNHLGREMAVGFFGDEEALVENRLKRQRIANNDALSKPEKRQLLQELESELPEHVREVRQQSRTINNLHRRVRELREQGASEETIHAVRTREVGPEAADRLARLDRDRQQWQQKLSDYQEKKSAIEANKGLTRKDRQEAIHELRKSHFDSAHERRRAKALSRLSNDARAQALTQQDQYGGGSE